METPDPLDFVALFNPDNKQSAESPPAKFSYKDHGTTFVSLKVWLEKAHRAASDADVFMQSSLSQPVEPSHLYYHKYRIIHMYMRQLISTRIAPNAVIVPMVTIRTEGRPEHCTVQYDAGKISESIIAFFPLECRHDNLRTLLSATRRLKPAMQFLFICRPCKTFQITIPYVRRSITLSVLVSCRSRRRP